MIDFPVDTIAVELSARIEYALLALLEMASRPDRREPIKINEITANQPIPDRYLEQILTSLRRGGIVQSQRGARGGYILTREPWQITLLEVVSSIEGDRKEKGSNSSIERDLVNEVWQQADDAFKAILSRYTLEDLCQRRNDQLQVNPMYHI
ncbi:RrF2 family transcriptional regulator [Egbenema bharatensis]|uniref:RrF2 family transcriptional regulator n=1 Tax=Egbenema bharatensis TaxID=3463334 RepID=UPI003A84C4B2